MQLLWQRDTCYLNGQMTCKFLRVERRFMSGLRLRFVIVTITAAIAVLIRTRYKGVSDKSRFVL